jgi:acyl carrier protein
VQDKIIQLIARVKEDSALTYSLTGPSHLVDDVGLDSLQLINLILLIEEEFSVQVDFDSFQIQHLNSLDRFTEYVAGLPKA